MLEGTFDFLYRFVHFLQQMKRFKILQNKQVKNSRNSNKLKFVNSTHKPKCVKLTFNISLDSIKSKIHRRTYPKKFVYSPSPEMTQTCPNWTWTHWPKDLTGKKQKNLIDIRGWAPLTPPPPSLYNAASVVKIVSEVAWRSAGSWVGK